jgi:hypothetical protein
VEVGYLNRRHNTSLKQPIFSGTSHKSSYKWLRHGREHKFLPKIGGREDKTGRKQMRREVWVVTWS